MVSGNPRICVRVIARISVIYSNAAGTSPDRFVADLFAISVLKKPSIVKNEIIPSTIKYAIKFNRTHIEGYVIVGNFPPQAGAQGLPQHSQQVRPTPNPEQQMMMIAASAQPRKNQKRIQTPYEHPSVETLLRVISEPWS